MELCPFSLSLTVMLMDSTTATLFPNKQMHHHFLFGGTEVALNNKKMVPVMCMVEPKYEAPVGPFSSLGMSTLLM